MDEARSGLSIQVAPDFAILLEFDANVPADFRPVIQHAADEWTTILLTRGVNADQFRVDVRLEPELTNTPHVLAQAIAHENGDHELQGGELCISPVANFYVDPNLGDDTEFAQNPPADHDLLTVVRHEFGHIVGWDGLNLQRTATLTANFVFDSSRLNIAMATVDCQDNPELGPWHADPVAHPDELMQPCLPGGTRRAIRIYPTAALPARAYENEIPMHFVDTCFAGPYFGSASHPWGSPLDADLNAPNGTPIMLGTSCTHIIASDQALTRNHEWTSARGGAAIRGR